MKFATSSQVHTTAPSTGRLPHLLHYKIPTNTTDTIEGEPVSAALREKLLPKLRDGFGVLPGFNHRLRFMVSRQPGIACISFYWGPGTTLPLSLSALCIDKEHTDRVWDELQLAYSRHAIKASSGLQEMVQSPPQTAPWLGTFFLPGVLSAPEAVIRNLVTLQVSFAQLLIEQYIEQGGRHPVPAPRTTTTYQAN